MDQLFAFPTGLFPFTYSSPTDRGRMLQWIGIVRRGGILYLFTPRPRSAGNSASLWERRVDEVASVEEVVAVTRDYLATFSPEYLGRLPADCRPDHIKYPDDIEFWAQQLAQRYCRENDEPVDGDLLHDLLDYFLHALIRLAQLHRNLPGSERIKAQ